MYLFEYFRLQIYIFCFKMAWTIRKCTISCNKSSFRKRLLGFWLFPLVFQTPPPPGCWLHLRQTRVTAVLVTIFVHNHVQNKGPPFFLQIFLIRKSFPRSLSVVQPLKLLRDYNVQCVTKSPEKMVVIL